MDVSIMHEMALTRSVLDIVLDEAEKAQASSVQTVRVVIGSLRDIVDEQFEGMFAWLARDTMAQGAQLELLRVPCVVSCPSCGCQFSPEFYTRKEQSCPKCGNRQFNIISGREFYIESIELRFDSQQTSYPNDVCA